MDFKVYFRIEGIPQDAILEDQERMTEIQKLVDYLRSGYHTESIIPGLGKTGQSTGFSEESSRTIQEMGNVELCELGETFRTVQCQACLKHEPEGLIYCSCGMCFRPSPEQKQRIKTQFEVVTVHHCPVRVNYSRGAKHCENQ